MSDVMVVPVEQIDVALKILGEGLTEVLEAVKAPLFTPSRDSVKAIRVRPWLYDLLARHLARREHGDCLSSTYGPPRHRVDMVNYNGIPVVPGPRLEFVV